jgi:hypothetical protein
MDCQHEYVSAGDSDYHGLLLDDPGECINQVAEKGINRQIADG